MDIDAELRICEAATPGPWSVYPHTISGSHQRAIEELVYQVDHTEPVGHALYLLNADGKCPAITGCGPTSEANATFLEHAREGYPKALRELAEARARIAELERQAEALEEALAGLWRWSPVIESAVRAAYPSCHPGVWGALAQVRAALAKAPQAQSPAGEAS
jgi:hypothetical protein